MSIGVGFGGSSNTNFEQGTSNTTNNKTYGAPGQTSLQQALAQYFLSLVPGMTSGTLSPNVQAMETQSADQINQTAKATNDRVTNFLASRGMGSSGVSGSAALQTELGRESQLAANNANFSGLQLQQNNANLLAALNYAINPTGYTQNQTANQYGFGTGSGWGFGAGVGYTPRNGGWGADHVSSAHPAERSRSLPKHGRERPGGRSAPGQCAGGGESAAAETEGAATRRAGHARRKLAERGLATSRSGCGEARPDGRAGVRHPAGGRSRGRCGETAGTAHEGPVGAGCGVKPDKPEKPPAGAALTLNEALSKGGQQPDARGQVYLGTLPPLVPGLPSQPLSAAPPPDRLFPVAGGGRMYIPSEEAQQADKDRAEAAKGQRAAANKKAEEEAKNYSLPDEVAAQVEANAGLKPGTLQGKTYSKDQWDQIFKIERKPQAAHIVANDEGDVAALDPSTGKILWTAKGVGKKGKDTEGVLADQRIQDAKEKADQARRDRIHKQANDLEAKEHAQWNLAATYDTLLSQPDVDKDGIATRVPLPGSESKATVALKTFRAKFTEKRDAAKKQAQMYLDQKRKLLASAGVDVGQPQADASQSAPAQGPPQRAQQTQGAPAAAAPPSKSANPATQTGRGGRKQRPPLSAFER
jgi:hypothetical protein